MVPKFQGIFRICPFFVRICKLVCFLFVCLLFLNWFSFGYQQQWFVNYQEWEKWIFFECKRKCAIMLWDRWDTDVLGLDWAITWSGSFIVLSENWNKNSILYGDKVSYDWNSYLILPNYKKSLNNIPKKAKLSIQVVWDIKWNLKIDKISSSFWQKILKGWKDFWVMEPLYQYGINMRYWVSIRWNSIIKYWYAVFMLSLVWILIFVKWKKIKKLKIIFYVWLWLFLFIWIRNTITYTYILNQWLTWFRDNKEFFDVGDFIPFIEEVRNKLNLSFEEAWEKDCKIFMKTNGNRNINDHWWFYLKPCNLVATWDLADYKIYYKVNIPREDLDKKVLLDFNGSYLLDNKLK